MKIDFKQKLVNFNGIEIHQEKDKCWTLEEVSMNALLSPDDKIDGKTKYERYELARKVKANEDLSIEDLSIEEISMIKELIGKVYPPVLVGPAWDLLEDK